MHELDIGGKHGFEALLITWPWFLSPKDCGASAGDAKTHVGIVAYLGGFFHDVVLEARRLSFHGLIVLI